MESAFYIVLMFLFHTIRNYTLQKLADYSKDNSHSLDVIQCTISGIEFIFYEQYEVISCIATDLNNDRYDKYRLRNGTKQ